MSEPYMNAKLNFKTHFTIFDPFCAPLARNLQKFTPKIFVSNKCDMGINLNLMRSSNLLKYSSIKKIHKNRGPRTFVHSTKRWKAYNSYTLWLINFCGNFVYNFFKGFKTATWPKIENLQLLERNRFLRGINAKAESIPSEELMLKNRYQLPIKFLNTTTECKNNTECQILLGNLTYRIYLL